MPTATLIHREDLTPDLAIFRLALDGGVPPFEAGQFLLLGIAAPDMRREHLVWRPYSITSAPEESTFVEFYIRRIWKPEPGLFTTVLWTLSLGDTLFWKPPRGRFTIDEQRADGMPHERRLLMLGGGTGLAPFVSQVRHLARTGSRREVLLCHGASYVDELGYRDLLLELERAGAAGGPLRFRYLPTVSRPDHERNRGWEGHWGRVEALLARDIDELSTAERATGAAFGPDDTLALVCGYGPTVRNVVAELRARGFLGPKMRAAHGSVDVKVDSFG